MPVLLASPNYSTLFMLAAMALAFWFLLVRPMKKQAQAFAERQEELRTQVQPGVRVQLNGGLFGTVAHVGEKQIVLELAPGVQVTALKDSIGKIVGPEDEEFEFEDDSVTDAVDLTDEQPTESVDDQLDGSDEPREDSVEEARAAEPADEWAAPVSPEQR